VRQSEPIAVRTVSGKMSEPLICDGDGQEKRAYESRGYRTDAERSADRDGNESVLRRASKEKGTGYSEAEPLWRNRILRQKNGQASVIVYQAENTGVPRRC